MSTTTPETIEQTTMTSKTATASAAETPPLQLPSRRTPSRPEGEWMVNRTTGRIFWRPRE